MSIQTNIRAILNITFILLYAAYTVAVTLVAVHKGRSLHVDFMDGEIFSTPFSYSFVGKLEDLCVCVGVWVCVCVCWERILLDSLRPSYKSQDVQ